jgi:hypothetical protein
MELNLLIAIAIVALLGAGMFLLIRCIIRA